MPIKWMIFFFTTWTILAFIGMGVEQAFAGVGVGGGYTTIMNTLMSANILQDVTVGGRTVFWLPNTEWFGAVLSAYAFRFSFFRDNVVAWIGYFIVFVPIIVSMVIATMFSLRGSASS